MKKAIKLFPHLPDDVYTRYGIASTTPKSHSQDLPHWCLPAKRMNGSWDPGDWTEKRGFQYSKITPGGWELTTHPSRHWQDRDDIRSYWAEYDDPIITVPGGNFFCTKMRLLRPLTHDELARNGVHLSGVQDVISDGPNVIRGAKVNRLEGGRVTRLWGGYIGNVWSGEIDQMVGGVISRMYGGHISVMSGGTVDQFFGGSICRLHGGEVRGVASGVITDVYGGEIVCADNSVATITIRGGDPKVTLKGRGVCIDRRVDPPVVYVGQPGHSLTILPSGRIVSS